MTPTEIASQYAALKAGRVAVYVGGGRIRVYSCYMTGVPCARYVTTTEARAAIETKRNAASTEV